MIDPFLPNTTENQFLQAIASKDLSRVRSLVETGKIDINAKNLDSVFNSFLEATITLNSSLKIIQYLIDKGADGFVRSRYGATILHLSILLYPKSILLLLKRFPGLVKIRDEMQGYLPLHSSAQQGQLSVIKSLLELSIGSLTKEDISVAIKIAASKNHNEIVEYLSEKITKIEREIVHTWDDDEFSLEKEFFKNALWREYLELNTLEKIVKFEHQAWILRYPDTTLLHVKASYGDLASVQYLLEKHPDLVDQKDYEKNTALMIAAAGKHRETVEYLANFAIAQSSKQALTLQSSKEIDPSIRLFQEIQLGHFKAVKSLITHTPGLLEARNTEHVRPLDWALRHKKDKIAGYLAVWELYELLLEENESRIDEKRADSLLKTPKINLDLKVDGTSLLHLCAENGHENFSRKLLEAGANIAAKNKDGLTALELVEGDKKSKKIVELLQKYTLFSMIQKRDQTGLDGFLEHKKPCLSFKDKQALIQKAIDDNAVPILERLFCYFAYDSKLIGSAFELILKNTLNKHHNKLIKKVLAERPKLFAWKNPSGQTLLDLAKQIGVDLESVLLLHFISTANLRALRVLLESKSLNLNIRDSNNQPLLHQAIDYSRVLAKPEFCSSSREIDVKKRSVFDIREHHKRRFDDEIGQKAPFRKSSTHIEVAFLLLQHNIKTTWVDSQGNTGLHIAVKRGSLALVRALVQRNLNLLWIKNMHDQTPLALSDTCHTPHMTAYLEEQMLLNCIQTQDQNRLKVILKRKSVDLNMYDENSLLNKAIKTGNLEIVKCLVKRGANINRIDSAGRTVLHSAVFYDQTEIFIWLAEQASFELVMHKDRAGDMVLQLARELNRELIVDYLTTREPDGCKPYMSISDNGNSTIEYDIQPSYPPDHWKACYFRFNDYLNVLKIEDEIYQHNHMSMDSGISSDTESDDECDDNITVTIIGPAMPVFQNLPSELHPIDYQKKMLSEVAAPFSSASPHYGPHRFFGIEARQASTLRVEEKVVSLMKDAD